MLLTVLHLSAVYSTRPLKLVTGMRQFISGLEFRQVEERKIWKRFRRERGVYSSNDTLFSSIENSVPTIQTTKCLLLKTIIKVLKRGGKRFT